MKLPEIVRQENLQHRTDGLKGRYTKGEVVPNLQMDPFS